MVDGQWSEKNNHGTHGKDTDRHGMDLEFVSVSFRASSVCSVVIL